VTAAAIVAQCGAVAEPSDLTPRRPHRLILPLGLRVLVRIIRDHDRTDSGLYLPAGAKEAQDEATYGEVVEVARDRPTSEEIAENVSGVPHGARVLFRKEAGVRVPWDEGLRLLDVKDVLATVEEIGDDEAH
jgi:co-chaperonin GroES (HSP10)